MESSTTFNVDHAFDGKQLLLLGSTGFLGKVVLYNLLSLRSSVDIVLMIRHSNRQTATQRFHADILQTPLFSHLKDQLGAAAFNLALSRVKVIAGDITLPKFGLDHLQFTELANDTDLVINSAASVNFQEPLHHALKINTYSIDNILSLCRPRSVPVLHVSTCYVNGYRKGRIKETLDKPRHMDIPQTRYGHYLIDGMLSKMEEIISSVRQAREDNDKAFCQKMTEVGEQVAHQCGFNDSYTLTKWLAEQRLVNRRFGCPVSIVRPSIIESSCAQPFPGWLEGVKVADAVIYAYAKSKLHSFPARKNRTIDIIPVDLVANSCMLAAAELISDSAPSEVNIYQCCSGSRNPLSIQTLKDAVVDVAQHRHHAYTKLFSAAPKNGLRIIPPFLFHTVMSAYRSYVGLAKLFNPERSSKKLNRLKTAEKLVKLFAFYAAPDYRFDNSKLRELHQRVSISDQNRYPVSPDELDWHQYISQVHVPGLNDYALGGAQSNKASVNQAA
ncbi:fatty acyl-CoA reductase [Aestuariibacter salexigens]|uniref:fatty acyl-CoA reductase n=1 Tax=Aestuariibacter salexigens TaxID=226010 RepID=UPI0003F6DDB6|nr:fatty acyl-CoA reductase [Aestuariibacter salexigens]